MCYTFMPRQSRRAEETGREEITTRGHAAPDPVPAGEPALSAHRSAERSLKGFLGGLKKLWARRKEEQAA